MASHRDSRARAAVCGADLRQGLISRRLGPNLRSASHRGAGS